MAKSLTMLVNAAVVVTFAAGTVHGARALRGGKDVAVVTHNVNLRRDPSVQREPVRLLHVGDTLQRLTARPVNGFYHVRAGRDTGWVWMKNVRVRPSPVEAARATGGHAVRSAHACADPHYRWAEKTGTVEGEAAEVTVHEILTGWNPPPIANTAADWCLVRDPSEQRVVTVVGYVRRVKKEADGDWHIELTNGPRETVANRCIVVEIPPGDGAPAFAEARRELTALLGRQTLPTTYDPSPAVQVRVTGAAFFDGEHRGSAARPMTAHQHGRCNSSARALWEIHPVTAVGRP